MLFLHLKRSLRVSIPAPPPVSSLSIQAALAAAPSIHCPSHLSQENDYTLRYTCTNELCLLISKNRSYVGRPTQKYVVSLSVIRITEYLLFIWAPCHLAFVLSFLLMISLQHLQRCRYYRCPKFYMSKQKSTNLSKIYRYKIKIQN